MKLNFSPRALLLVCALLWAGWASAQNSTCLTADPFCTGTPVTFPAGINAGTGEVGPDYGCLLTQPNPAWYYMEIATGGNLDIEITNSNNEDIDFILYGPFVDQTSPCTALLTAGNTEDCSYSTSATEIANIVGAVPGEFYLMMITNFSNNSTDISFGELASSTATTNCAIVCPPIDFGVWNGTTVEQTPLTLDCDDAAVLLLADEDGFNPGEAISPCIVIQVFPTNANNTLNVEFFENGTSLGSLVPGPNLNWSGFLSLADPDVSHAFVLSEGAASGSNMSYQVLDCHTGTVLASGTWVDDGNPQTVTINPPPNLSGTAGYTVTPAAGNPGLTTFDWGGAVWDPSAVPPGSYDITYSWNDGAGNCSGTATHTFIVTNPYTSTFSYSQASYCQNASDPTPTITGTAGGGFTSSPGGLALNASTGAIDVSSSGTGTYDVTYFTGTALPSSCNSSTTVQVTIIANDDPAFTYPQNTYCAGDADPSPSITGDAGGAFSSTGGLVINGGTGLIDLDASTAGSYVVTYTTPGPCVETATFNITINAEDDPSFTYPQNTYCAGDADPTPTITGTGGGTFSAPAQVSINGSSGVIDLSGSTPGGPYTITYTTPGPACPNSTTFQITINPDQDASFTYPQNTYCAGDADPSPTITGTAGGTFSSTAGLSITAGGLIDLDASTAASYVVTYTTAGPCAASSTFNITINAEQDPSFTYPQNTYCAGDSDPTPTITGTGGGTFTAPVQVSINGSTGVIDLSGSTPGGPYSVTYTTPGPNCANSTTFQITINPDQDASFTYPQNTYCASDTDPMPTITGTGGGTFSGTAGLSINGGTGLIDLDASTAAAHIVTYTTPGPCAASSTFNITINPDDDPSFSYAQNTYCESDADPTPTITGLAGGTFSAPVQVSINGSTGAIDLSNSTVGGPYTITYLTNGNCPQSATFQITINPDDDPSFSYGATTYCAGDADPTPTITGDLGGTFSGSGGLVIDGSTGVIDLDASTTGSHTITYTTAGPCVQSATFNITINAEDDPAFAYGQATYCEHWADPTPVVSGTAGGTFSGPAQISINGATGTIDLSNSTVGGPYTITYTTPGPACPNSSTFDITILPAEDSTFTYSQATYCLTGSDPTPTITGTAGGAFSGSGTLVINSSTGLIDLDASGVGTYTVTYTTPGPNCITSMGITVTITTAPSALFNYNGPYCQGDPNGASPTFGAGASAGSFSYVVVSGGPNLAINVNTGDVDLTNSDPGTYDVTNDIAASGGCAAASSTAQIVVDPQDDPSFTYASPFCQSDSIATATITGTTGGIFSEDGGSSVIFNSTATGEIDLQSTPPGSYSIQYLTTGTCLDSTTFAITINPDDDPTFSYANPAYCMNDVDPSPTITGTAGGTFTSTPAGLSINGSTGVIDLDASTGNTTYTITYTTPGPNCVQSMSVTVTVDAVDQPTFNYSQLSYCTSDPNQFPTITGTAGGSFGVTPAGLVINSATGEVDVVNSTIGNYTITYVTNGICPDSANVPFSITTALNANISAAGPFCSNDAAVTLTAVDGGGVWSGPGITDVNAGTFDPSAANTGTNDVVYIISGGCGDVDTLQITVEQFEDPTITNAPASVCEGLGPINLDATDEVGIWSGPGITDAATGAWDPASAGGAGTYTVYHTIATNCGGVDSVTIVVDPLPAAPVGVNATMCIGDPVPALSAVGGGGTFTWYSDAAGTNVLGTGASFTPTVNGSGVITVYVSETLGNCEGPLTAVTLTVGGPIASFIATPDNGMAPLSVYFDNTSTGGSTYAWDFGDGGTSTAFDPTYVYVNWGDFDATLTVTDSLGCSAFASWGIHVEAESEVQVPNVFSPNNDGSNDVWNVEAENLVTLVGTISNRWGQVVAEINTVNGGWDGRNSAGEYASDGTYFYILTATGADGQVYNLTGHFMLIK